MFPQTRRAIRRFFRCPMAWAALLWLAGAGAAVADAPRVVVSIKPLHSLVASVMRGVGQPELLLKGAASPHTYTLRPSDARLLTDAEIVFWTGGQLEAFLAKPLASLSGGARVVALAMAADLRLLKAREGGEWDPHDPVGEVHGHGHGHGEDHRHADAGAGRDGHGPDRFDMHVWLDPENAGRMVGAVARTLSDMDPANAPRYAANAERLLQDVSALDREIAASIAPVRSIPYLVFHDAYQYFEARYQMNAVGSITVSPERKPGAKRLHALRKRVVESKVACVFAEPQFEPALVRTVVDGTPARSGVLDPEGATIPEGPDLYFVLMRSLAACLQDCLRPASSPRQAP